MAAPPEKTLRNLGGDWTMNKALSENTDAFTAMQGVGWVIRKAIQTATINIKITEIKNADGVVELTINQSTSGIKGADDTLILDGKPRHKEVGIVGELEATNTWIKTADLSDAHLREGWEDDVMNGEAVQLDTASPKNGWKASAVWGFQRFDGVRHLARHMIITKGSERVQARAVYDYKG